MAATKQIIRGWLKEAPKGATHMAVVCDTCDWEDYPVYVEKGEDAHKRLEGYEKGENMQRLMEIYNLSMDIEKQLDEHRALHY